MGNYNERNCILNPRSDEEEATNEMSRSCLIYFWTAEGGQGVNNLKIRHKS